MARSNPKRDEHAFGLCSFPVWLVVVGPFPREAVGLGIFNTVNLNRGGIDQRMRCALCAQRRHVVSLLDWPFRNTRSPSWLRVPHAGDSLPRQTGVSCHGSSRLNRTIPYQTIYRSRLKQASPKGCHIRYELYLLLIRFADPLVMPIACFYPVGIQTNDRKSDLCRRVQSARELRPTVSYRL